MDVWLIEIPGLTPGTTFNFEVFAGSRSEATAICRNMGYEPLDVRLYG